MNISYCVTMLVAALCGAAWFALRLRKQRQSPFIALCALALSAVFAFLLAKAFYDLLLFKRVYDRFLWVGWEAFYEINKAEFSFFGGCVGVVLGVMLSSRLFKANARRVLDAFAPCGALLVALARYAERYLGMVGVGKYTENAFFCRFPFGVTNDWGEWFLAVFMLEALIALIIAVVFAVIKPVSKLPGLRMAQTAYYLAVTQIFCESLRAQCMKWGFVRAEQVMCAVYIAAFLLYCCLKAKERGAWKRYWPMAGALLCVLVIVGIEFALDKTQWSHYFSYGVMILSLIGFGALERFCSTRRIKQAA